MCHCRSEGLRNRGSVGSVRRTYEALSGVAMPGVTAWAATITFPAGDKNFSYIPGTVEVNVDDVLDYAHASAERSSIC